MKPIMQLVQARMQRWHLLGRYYVNKWRYDSSKWADRIWYGKGRIENGSNVASVAFMITRNMRQQLLDAGFPASTISTLQPATAHHIISKKILFSQFEDIRKEQQVEQAAERLSAEVAADGKKKSEQDAPSAVVVTKSTAVFSKHHIGASPNLQRVKI